MDLTQIDWNVYWKEAMDANQGTQNFASVWDRQASRWNLSTMGNGDYAHQVVSRMRLEPDWTVMDVGCGTGALAIPIAKRVKSVTAVDVSSEMLRYLQENATREGLTNIECRNQLMEDMVIDKDVDRHDVVIASRSIAMAQRDLKRALVAINNAAKRYAYVTLRASERTFDIGVCKAVGRKHKDSPNYIIICNALNQMGIYANVELLLVEFSMTFQSFDEAVDECRKRFATKNEPLIDEEENRLTKHLKKTLKRTADGRFKAFDRKPAWAFISWRKDQSSGDVRTKK